MQLPVFEQAWLLQSFGWAIVNSLWQTGSLWLLYELITAADKKLPSVVKYNISIGLMLCSLLWFVLTIAQCYVSLRGAGTFHGLIFRDQWVIGLRSLEKALPFITILYLIFLFAQSVRFLKDLSTGSFLQSHGLTKAPVDIRLFVNKTALHLGIKRKTSVCLSDLVGVPSVTGFIKPVILLPVSFITNLSARQIEAVLLHELAHIRRNDYLVNIMQSGVELILFFNPFIKLLSTSAKKERENCCDDWVMNFQYDRHEYGKALLVLEENRQYAQNPFALAATNGKKNLLLRVKRLFIVAPQTNVSTQQKLKLSALYIALVTCMFAILPFLHTVPATEKVARTKATTGDNLPGVALNQPKEIFQKKILTGKALQPLKEKASLAKKKAKQDIKKTVEEDYVNAFINEDLLHPNLPVEPVITLVADRETDHSRYLVIIEEQQSGIRQTNTYYLELSSKDGNAAVKPLVILNKIVTKGKKVSVKNTPDSLKIPQKLPVTKRITS